VSRVVALIDGEHYPPVVRSALEALGRDVEVAGAVFLGGTEKVDAGRGESAYGVEVVWGENPRAALADALERFKPSAVIDLSDEPVLSAGERFELACVALAAGVDYRGADFEFRAPKRRFSPATPTLAVIGTGKRVGKTAVSAAIARELTATGTDLVVLAMGRGGPDKPEIIHGEEVALTTADLLALAREGAHASSDNYEDAVMSRVTTVGSRRCGGGLAGEVYFGNVIEGALLADSLGKQLLIAEGSGAAIPPVHFDAAVLVVGAARGEGYVRDYFGPYRLALADLVVIAGAEEPLASQSDVSRILAAIEEVRPGVPIVAIGFRPRPVESVAGRKVLYVTTAPPALGSHLGQFLSEEYDCEIVAVSTSLSDRQALRADLAQHAGTFDCLVTELKAAAIDVVAAEGERLGVPVVLADNVPVAVDGHDFAQLVGRVAARAVDRATARMRAGA
jgi:cyclic 2,3-diphosphoglycerate synthetase